MRYLGELGTWAIGMVGSIYAFVTGHTDQAVQILIAMMIIDVMSGLMKGFQRKRLKSAIMSLGIMKKGGMLLAIVFASLLDQLINHGQPVFRTMMVWLSIGNECLSITENLSALGVVIPEAITGRLAQVVKEVQKTQLEKDGQDKAQD
ncbi:phage holin family protein [Priestia megaterium]|uniref:phage holin family protein n=1 Tax=Priestia megaterium TaxID=1404 RepID=UPI0020D21E25|nr:phage holin family protein [Priestia megaterium]